MKEKQVVLNKNSLLFPVGITRLVFSMVTTILPLYLLEMGFSTVNIGIIMSIYGYAALLIGLASSTFIDNIKKTFVIKLGVFLISVCFLFYCIYVKSIMYQFFLQILLGFSFGLFRPASMALTSELSVPKKVGTALSYYNVASIVGSCLGPVLATTITKVASYTSVFVISFILSIIMLIYTMVTLNFKSNVKKVEGFHIKLNFRIMYDLIVKKKLYIPIIYILVDIVILRLWMTYLPLYIKGHSSFNIGQIGIIFSIESLAYVLTQPFWGKMVDTLGYKIPLVIGIIAPVITMFTSYIDSFFGLVVLYFLMGMLNSAAYPAYMNLTIKCSGKEEKGMSMALMTSASDSAYILGPILGGIIFSIWGSFRFIFLFSIIPSLIGVLVFLFSFKKLDTAEHMENI